MNRDIQQSAMLAAEELNRHRVGPGGKPDEVYGQLLDIHFSVHELQAQQDLVRQALRPAIHKAKALFLVGRLPRPADTSLRIAVTLARLASDSKAYAAGQAIVDLYLANELRRLRSCARCMRWFVAAQRKRRYCSNSCRSVRWQSVGGRRTHYLSYRKWWLTKIGLLNVKGKLRSLPKGRSLTRAEQARKERYLEKEARYQRELAQVESLMEEAGSTAKAKKTSP
jgi:hypothetical protein